MSKQAIRYESTFYTVAEVRVRHTYYQGGICKDWQIQPTPASQWLLRQYGLLFKSQPDGFLIFGVEGQVRDSVVFSGELVLDFDMQVSNPYFLNSTELEMVTDQGLFFENGQENGSFLHSARVVDASCRRDEWTEGGLKGRLSLKINSNNGLFGRNERPDPEPAHTYVIQFEARKVWLQYWLVGHERFGANAVFSVHPLSDAAKSSVFEQGEVLLLPSGTSVLEISSKSLVYLAERPSTGYRLFLGANPNPDQLQPLKNLPAPHPGAVKMTERGAICEIYVNL